MDDTEQILKEQFGIDLDHLEELEREAHPERYTREALAERRELERWLEIQPDESLGDWLERTLKLPA